MDEDKFLPAVVRTSLGLMFIMVSVTILDIFLAQRQVAASIPISEEGLTSAIQNLNYLPLLEQLPKKEDDYDIVEIDLELSRANKPLNLSGSSMTIKDLTGTASIRFNSLDKKPVFLVKGEVYDMEFTNLYLSNAAQLGKALTLFIGKRT